MYIKKGQTRIVFVFKKNVFKIPNFINGYKFLLLGLLANLNEKQWNGYQEKLGKFIKKLCPVVFSFPFGLFLIMKRATTISEEEFFVVPKNYFDGLPIDNHRENFGFYNGHLVLIDYGEFIIESMFCPKCNNFLDEI